MLTIVELLKKYVTLIIVINKNYVIVLNKKLHHSRVTRGVHTWKKSGGLV